MPLDMRPRFGTGVDRLVCASRPRADFMTRRLTIGRWTVSAILLAIAGVGLALAGIYFLLGSGLIDHIQKMTIAAMAMADMNVWAQRS